MTDAKVFAAPIGRELDRTQESAALRYVVLGYTSASQTTGARGCVWLTKLNASDGGL